MRALGRKGGQAIPKAKREDAQRQSLRDYLRKEVDPAAVWAAIQSSLASGNKRDRLASAKLLLSELYEPAAEREREREHVETLSKAKERLEAMLDERAVRSLKRTQIERGLAGAGGGRPFEGLVMFGLRELAEWAASWAPGSVGVSEVVCSMCGDAGVRLVGAGGDVSDQPIHCPHCRPNDRRWP